MSSTDPQEVSTTDPQEVSTTGRYATYNGLIDMIGDVVGPGLNGKYWVATDAFYNGDTDTTRVEFDEYFPKDVGNG